MFFFWPILSSTEKLFIVLMRGVHWRNRVPAVSPAEWRGHILLQTETCWKYRNPNTYLINCLFLPSLPYISGQKLEKKKISLFHSFAVFTFMFCYSLNFLFIHLFPHEHVHRWITSVMLDEITPPLEFSSCSSFDSYTPDEGKLSENVIGKSCVLNIAIIIKSLQNHPFLFGQIGDCSLNSINHALMSFTAPSGASGLNLFLC